MLNFLYIHSFRQEEPFALGRKRRNIRFSKSDSLADTQANCANVANELMMFANGRVFVDYLYPDEKYKEIIRRYPYSVSLAKKFRLLNGMDIMKMFHIINVMVDLEQNTFSYLAPQRNSPTSY